MLSLPRSRVTTSVPMHGPRAQEASVTQPTLRAATGVDEVSIGPAGKLAAALGGLSLFAGSFAAFRLTDAPLEGVWAVFLEISGWLGMLAAARIVTRRWLAPTLVLTAWLLLVVGNSFGTRLIQRGTDRGLELGFNYVTALITLETGAWLLIAILMLDGAARLWREDTQRAQARG